MKILATFSMLSAAALCAHAQPVYRCGSEYSQTPCAQGRLVDVSDTRTDAQRAEARRVVADQARLGDTLRRERLADEAALKPARATSLSGPAAAHAKPVEPLHAKRKKPHAPGPASNASPNVAPAGDITAMVAAPIKKRRSRV